MPLYHQVYNIIKEYIKDGKFTADQPLPNQIELAKQFKVSEITMRRALTELANEGWVLRTRGKGTYINNHATDGKNTARDIRPFTLKQIYLAFQMNTLIFMDQRFQSDLISGIHDFCEQYGIRFRLWEIDGDEKLPIDEHTGIILMPQYHMSIQQLQTWKETTSRLITVHVYFPHLHIPYIISDNLTGGYSATQHLISLGHRRIGIILSGNSTLDLNQDFSFRLQGYRLALDHNKLEFDESMVSVVQGDQELESMGKEGTEQLFALENPPTAVFATSDLKAFGCIRALRDKGIRVPEDVSVVGYDDMKVSQYISPALTTIDQNSYQMGWRACEVLTFEWDEGWRKAQYKDEIVPKLIVRESTGPRS